VNQLINMIVRRLIAAVMRHFMRGGATGAPGMRRPKGPKRPR